MRKALSLLCVVALSACGGGGTQSTTSVLPMSQDAAARTASVSTSFAATTWNIGTGASYNYYSDQLLDFLPTAITINAGDSIAFHVASGAGGDPHTVAFVPSTTKVPPPGDPNNLSPAGGTIVDGTKFVNSGILFGGQVFTLRFSKPGTFRILCLFHEPAMVMTVTVQPTGTPYPHNAQYYLNVGATDEWQDFFEARQSVAQFPFPSGGTTFAAGVDPGLVHFPPPDSTILRFLNSNQWSLVANGGSKTIKAGTVITWVNETSNEPHTVTVLPAGQTELPAALTPDPAVNAVPYPSVTIFDGTKLVNSGTLVRAPGAPFAFAVKFTKPGVYHYACIYHDNSGMDGVITVNQ